MARKKNKPEEHDNTERWMVSYADFVTLLFAFFTCLYAISSVDAAKMGQMVTSIRESFGGMIFSGNVNMIPLSNSDGGGTGILVNIPVNSTAESAAESEKGSAAAKVILSGDADMGRLKRALESMLSEEIRKNVVRIRLEARGLVMELGEDGMFDSGSDVIRPDRISTLDTIATALMNFGNNIRIEGHADSVPINTPRFPSNWHLASARATTVINRMVTHYGMSPDLLSVTSFGEYKPVASNATAEGRARNRRVEIVVMNPSYARYF